MSEQAPNTLLDPGAATNLLPRSLAQGANPEPATERQSLELIRRNSRAGVAWPLLTAFIISLAFLTIPHEALTNIGESSWCSVLVYAHQHGLQFGSDLIYTYGPLGFLTTFYYSGHALALRFGADLALCFGAAAGLCLLVWRANRLWRLLTLGMFTLFAANVPYGAQDLLIDVGLLSWGLLCFAETAPARIRIWATALEVFAVLGSLTKFTCLLAGGLTVCAVAAVLILRGQRWAGAGIVLGFFLGLVGTWIAAGQQMANLVPFLRWGFAVSKGYAQTMGLEPTTTVLVAGILVGLSALAAAAIRVRGFDADGKNFHLRRALLLGWLAGLLFLTWKHGFVRADRHHLVFFLGFAPVLGCAVMALPCGSDATRRWSQSLSLACTVIAILTLQWLLFPSFLSLGQPFRRAAANALSLLQPAQYCQTMQEQLNLEKQRSKLPVLRQSLGRGSVDVFGNFQSYAFLNELNYQPRPVFQSYAAFTAPLMQVNERFLLSDRAPEYFLVRIEAIDGRFAPLEDALVFRDLLLNYQFVGTEESFVLLHSNSVAAPKLTPIAEGSVRAGDPIDLKPYGDTDLWLEIDLQPTLVGSARQFAYQPPEVRLVIRYAEPGKLPRSYRAPAPMLANGFVASPLITRNEELRAFYSWQPMLRPASYSVETSPGGQPFWKPEIRYRLFAIDKVERPAAPAASVLSP